MDPAAWRDPEVETAEREVAVGEAKREEGELVALDEVRKPSVTRVEISTDAKVVPGMLEDLGLAFITEMYFTFKSSDMCSCD